MCDELLLLDDITNGADYPRVIEIYMRKLQLLQLDSIVQNRFQDWANN